MSTILIIIFSIFFLLIIVPRLLMTLKTARLKGKTAPTPNKASTRRIKSGEKTVLYFYTPTCRACTMQEPIIQQVSKKHPGAVFKIDASQNREAASAYGVLGVPFTAFIEEGIIVTAKAGVQTEAALNSFRTA